ICIRSESHSREQSRAQIGRSLSPSPSPAMLLRLRPPATAAGLSSFLSSGPFTRPLPSPSWRPRRPRLST
uniref:Uncharacterized protein n=1 Tax=Aegilops tauschii subsp. strangulata TaxID=200361 RepID=A0A453GSC4_AEGTS